MNAQYGAATDSLNLLWAIGSYVRELAFSEYIYLLGESVGLP